MRVHMRINCMFLYDFVDRHSRFEVFEKDRTTEKGAVILKWGIEARLHTCIGGWKKSQAESVCFVIVFLVVKKKAFKSSLLNCTFIPWLSNLLIYLATVQNIHTTAVANVSRDSEGRGVGSCSVCKANDFPRKDWAWVGGNFAL